MSVVEQLQGNVVDLSKMALGEGGADVRNVVEWMRSIPSTLTWLKIDVPNASAEVVAALHSLVAKTTTLAELDAMELDAEHFNLNVLKLNGKDFSWFASTNETRPGVLPRDPDAIVVTLQY